MRWVALFVAATVTTGCFLTSEPVDRLELSVTLSAVQVHADSGVTIRITAINRSDRAVYLNGSCPLGYDLVPPTNLDERLYNGGGRCRSGFVADSPTDAQSLEVPARDSVTKDHRLGFRAQSNWQNGVARWPAGRYEVVGLLMEDGRVVRRTAPVAFDLVCSDPTWPEC